ncbi:DUF2666 domain-containing protein [Candidatus Marsarchaeota archaeon]|nr:DUF2666 domain-containing protein [Candidatus Marsarchaeota archaeon]
MAPGDDSIDFFARYKDWITARSISITERTNPRDVAAYMVAVREDVDRRAFEVLGVDTGGLESYAERLVKPLRKNDYAELVNVYKQLGSKDTDAEISKATSGREELKPFAKACILRSAMKALGVAFYVSKNDKAFAGKSNAPKATNAVPFTSEGISFMAKYHDWVSIKKMSITENTKPEEVAAHLSSIRITADRKAALILGVNTANLDVYAAGITGNMRKSAANLERISGIILSADAKNEIEGACNGNAALKDAAQTYLFSTMLQNIKLDLEVSPDTLMDMFPGLKIPKPKGRMPGQKKKK